MARNNILLDGSVKLGKATHSEALPTFAGLVFNRCSAVYQEIQDEKTYHFLVDPYTVPVVI